MKKVISLILSLTMLLTVSAGFDITASAGEIRNFSVNMTYGQTEARTILDMINELRTGNDAWYWNEDNSTKTTLTNLTELEYDYELEKVAMQRAAEIAIYYSHTRPNGEACYTAYDDAGYSYTSMGENIAYGYNALTTAQSAHDAWTEADDDYSGQGHRRTMLSSDFTAVGIAHVYYNGRHYWVEEFSNAVKSSTATAANDSLTSCTISADMDLISHTYVYNYTNEATCTEQGYYESKTCIECGYTVSETGYVPALGHKYTSVTVDATAAKDGYTTYTCIRCGDSYTETIKATGYTISSASSASATSVTKPKKTKIKKLTSPKKKQIKITWKKKSNVTGYQIQYATNKKFTKNKKTVTVKGASKTSKTIKKLKSKKTYYVRVRTYKTVNGKKVYSNWSTIKKVKTK